MTATEREQEEQSTELLAQLPLSERRDILLPHQERQRQSRETRLIAPIIATRPDRGEAPGDRLLVESEYEVCERILAAADLSERERCVFMLHAQQQMTDAAIAGVLGRSRWTVNTTRRRAEAKIRAAVQAAALDPS